MPRALAEAICRRRLDDRRGCDYRGEVRSNGHRAEVKFYRNADHSLWGSTAEDWALHNEVLGTRNNVISVPAINFGKCLENYGIPFYLKADIVGSETICLRALLNVENKPDYISVRSEKLIFRKLNTNSICSNSSATTVLRP